MTETIGKYEVIRTLGKGATATVYLARDPDTDQQVAVKLIKFGEDNAAMSRRLRKLFQTEDSVGRRLDHPNIVRLYDAVVEEEQAYIAMEYVDGVSLEDFCRIDRLLRDRTSFAELDFASRDAYRRAIEKLANDIDPELITDTLEELFIGWLSSQRADHTETRQDIVYYYLQIRHFADLLADLRPANPAA